MQMTAFQSVQGAGVHCIIISASLDSKVRVFVCVYGDEIFVPKPSTYYASMIFMNENRPKDPSSD